MPKKLIKAFISYAHKDAPFFAIFKDALKSQLNTSDKFEFSAWEDSEIPLGTDWDTVIKSNLGNANLAILCVSAGFLNSRYIQENEFDALINQYPNTTIIPVYFNHCNFNANKKLAAKQFFKPGGDRYNKADKDDFAFCDLIKFRETDGTAIPNSNIDLYISDFVKKVEASLGGTADYYPPPGPEDKQPGEPFHKKEKKITDRIVEIAILAAIILSLFFIIYTFAFNGDDAFETRKFNGTIGAAMFFGSGGLFVVNRKFQHG